MKLIQKFLTISLFVFISVITQINYAICSENIPVARQPVNLPVSQQQPVQGVAQQVQQAQPQPPVSPELQQTQQLQQTQPPPSLPTTTDQGFFPALMNMISKLIPVIILIVAIAGIIVLYRRIKSKVPAVKKIKKEKVAKGKIKKDKGKKETAEEFEHKEPTTVSEAVSSFVRHKIKK